MRDKHFKTVEPLIDAAAVKIRTLLETPAAQYMKEMMREVAAELPKDTEIMLSIGLNVFHPDRKSSLPLIAEGISTVDGQEPYIASGDSSFHRYIVDGDMCQVPHDRCPHCWGEWDFKLDRPECQHCEYVLGKQVKMLLDSDICPHCERGRVSPGNPKCDKCGFEVDQRIVVWG